MNTPSLQTEQVRSYIDALFETNAVKIAKDPDALFVTRNGGESWIYVDHGDLIADKKGNQAFINALREIVEPQFSQDKTVLLNVLSKASAQTTGAIAYACGYSQIPFQSEEVKDLERGTLRMFRLPNMDKVTHLVIIDDVLTTGQTIVETMDILKKHSSLDITKLSIHAVVGLARKPKQSTQNLQKVHITPHWLTSLTAIIHATWPSLTEKQKVGLKQEYPEVDFQ